MTASSLNNLAGKSIVSAAFVGIGGSALATTFTSFGPNAGFVSGALIGITYLPFHYLLESVGMERNETIKLIGFIALQILNVLASNRLSNLGQVSITFGATLMLNVSILAAAFLIKTIYNYIYS